MFGIILGQILPAPAVVTPTLMSAPPQATSNAQEAMRRAQEQAQVIR